eukprot:5806610-Amphidinium_carterae.5
MDGDEKLKARMHWDEKLKALTALHFYFLKNLAGPDQTFCSIAVLLQFLSTKILAECPDEP